MKKIVIEIFRDGKIQAETKGIKGPSCKKYIEPLEKLTNAKAVKVMETSEYYESTDVLLEDEEVVVNRRND